MPRHIEQPARRHSKPAAVKILSRPFVLRLLLDARRAGDDERAHGRVDALAGHDRSRGAQVLDPRVGARPDEDTVDGDVRDLRAGRETHVRESPLDCVALPGIVVVRRVRHLTVDRDDHLRIRPPRHLRGELGHVDGELALESRVRIGGQ